MKSLMLLIFLGILGGAGCSKPSKDPQVTSSCESTNWDQSAVNYCVQESPGQNSKDVAVFFHGVDGSENSWSNEIKFQKLRQIWIDQKVPYPKIISVSLGQRWLLTDTATTELNKILLSTVADKVAALINQHRGTSNGLRILIGESMGGYNAAQLMLYRPQLFDRVALLSPGLFPISPFASDKELDDFFQRNQGSVTKDFVRELMGWTRKIFPSSADWARNNPLQKTLPIKGPELFVTSQSQDQLGLQEGARAFVSRWKQFGLRAEYHESLGGHCQETAATLNELAAFLTSRNDGRWEKQN